MAKLAFNGLKIKNKEAFNGIKKHNNREGKLKENINKNETHKNIILTKNNYTWDNYLQEKKEQIKTHNEKYNTKNRMIKEGSAFSINYTFQATKEHLTQEQHIQFLKDINKQLREHFKDQEVLESIIHLDETTPHLHFSLSFFNLKEMKFKQKELLQQEKTEFKNIEKALENILKKYNINERETLTEKIEKLPKTAQKEAQEILKLQNKQDKKNNLKRLFNKYKINQGGEAYIDPSLLKFKQFNTAREVQEKLKNKVNDMFNNNTNFLNILDKETLKKDITNLLKNMSFININIKEIKQQKELLKQQKQEFNKQKEYIQQEAKRAAQINAKIDVMNELQEKETLINELKKGLENNTNTHQKFYEKIENQEKEIQLFKTNETIFYQKIEEKDKEIKTLTFKNDYLKNDVLELKNILNDKEKLKEKIEELEEKEKQMKQKNNFERGR